MDDEQDWRLRADLADARSLAERLRDAGREGEPPLAPEVVLSADEDRLFAYANTRAAIDEARAVIERELASEGRRAAIRTFHWDDAGSDWHQVDPPPGADELAGERRRDDAQEQAAQGEGRIETRTVAVTSGKMARNWFETTVADEARELGVALSIVERPHLLSTQIAFTLTGERAKVEQVVADLQARAGAATRLETAYLTPI